MKILFIDFSTRLSSPADLTTRARGGMVSSLVRLPDELCNLGHDCFVLSDIPEDHKTDAGTIWCAADGGCWLKGEDWDFIIFNRGTAEGYAGLVSKHRILWTHDLPHNGFIQEPRIMNAFSATVFMSNYAERVWRSFYKTIGRSFQIPNGVDKGLFHPRLKNTNLLVFGSAPNRGLNRLPIILEAARFRIGLPLRLEAYSNISTMHPNEASFNDYGSDYKKVEDSEVDLYDPLPQEDWADVIGRAGAMIMPTDYPEICSNNILQALASGTPVFTTGQLGSACEWVKSGRNGYLTKWQVHDYMVYTVDLVRGLVGVLSDEKKHLQMIKNAAKTKVLSWSEVAAKWDRMFKKLL